MVRRKFDLITPELRDNILGFYSDLKVPIETKKKPGEWQNLLTGLDELKRTTPVTRATDASRNVIAD